jgi:hypothetical protein
LFLQFPHWDKQLWFWHHASVVCIFQATGATVTGNQTQDTFLEFWPSSVLFLVLRNKHAKLGANWCIGS